MPFTVNLYHDGMFVVRPLEYRNGDFKVIDDVDFDGMLYVQVFDIIRRVVLVSLTWLYFKLVDQPLIYLKPLKTDEDVGLFVKALYKNGSIIDLYCEHSGYDIMEIIENQLASKEQPVKTTFKCNADDLKHTSHENLYDLKEIVEFEDEGQTDDATSNLGGRFNHEENDHEDDIVDPKFKAKPFLKNMLANYGVANGYQLWFMQNDHRDRLDDVECSSKPATKKNGSKLWEYRQAVLESNLCSTCHLETEDRDDNGKFTFKRMYICLRELSKAWFLSLLQEDLKLGYSGGLIIISDGHKGLLEAVACISLDSEHKQCARTIYMPTLKESGVDFSIRDYFRFLLKMEQIKELDPAAHKWLVKRNPNSWCRAFFEIDRCSATFKNGISKSFNSKIVPAKEVGHNKKGCQNQPRAKPPGMGTSLKSQSVPDSSMNQSRPPAGKPLQNPTSSKGKGIAMEQSKKRDEEPPGLEDSLDNTYSFNIILDLQDNELNVHQVFVDLLVNEAPENYTT
nr:hypothetical protein [Tanacetum cinerariifolium]